MITLDAWRRAATVIAWLACSAVAHAAADAPAISLNMAVERVLTTHPALQRSQLNQAASLGDRNGMAQATPWSLAVEVENFAGTGDVSGLDGSETTVGVSKLFERGDKRESRIALGDANLNLLTTEEHQIRINVAAKVARAFIATLAEQRRFEVLEAGRLLAESIRDQVGRRVEVGRSAEAELATAEIAVARAGATSRRSAATLAKRQQHLAAALAEETPSFGELLGDIELLPQLSDFEQLKTKLDANPELALLAQQQIVRNAELSLAQANQHADFTFGAGVRQLAGPNDTALVVSFSMPLGQKRRATPLIEAARNRRESTPLLQSERRLELMAELFALDSDLRAVADEYRVLNEDILPVAQTAVRLYQTGFERGRYPLSELNTAQRTLLETQRDAINIAEQYQQLFITLTTVLGEIPGRGALP